jgi:hypothetical protein
MSQIDSMPSFSGGTASPQSESNTNANTTETGKNNRLNEVSTFHQEIESDNLDDATEEVEVTVKDAVASVEKADASLTGQALLEQHKRKNIDLLYPQKTANPKKRSAVSMQGIHTHHPARSPSESLDDESSEIAESITVTVSAVVLNNIGFASTDHHNDTDDSSGGGGSSVIFSSSSIEGDVNIFVSSTKLHEPLPGIDMIVGIGDRVSYLAMNNDPGTTKLNDPTMGESPVFAPLRPTSRLECEGRCGEDGFCDPSSKFGCGGEYCGHLENDL